MHIRPLPLQVRFIAEESTGSYVTRLASRNGLTVGRLLDSVGEGRSAPEVDPRYTELYVNRAARDRLAALVARPVEELIRALPSTADEHLLTERNSGPVWRWPWAPRGGFLVRGCALCAAARETDATTWRISSDMWHICMRHGRFTDNSRDDRVPFIDLSPGPHVVEAERWRRDLVRRLGPAGRVLVADAFGVLAHEATHLPRLGAARTTPLRLLPAAVRLASAMASVERRRVEGRMTSEEYALWVKQAPSQFGLFIGRVLGAWAAKHPLPHTPVPKARPGTHLPLAAPHERVGALQSVNELTCVPWEVLATVERPYG
ncbi:TniQ family protein [Streptomyces sp. SCL15-4]|uniref:TniQ family protein n=1 Tax=Streptomyces sp. SCL15-4 TaxID=2967221 RepID=UPI0029664325|nr:TniQ family protein [Streptomyces sp. SCL15-4]